MKKYLILLSVIFLISLNSHAQQNVGGTPYSIKNNTLSANYNATILPKPDMNQIQQEDTQDGKNGVLRKMGRSLFVNINLTNSGTWEELKSGDRIWRLKITCPDALALGIYYNHFWLPPGGKLYLYNEDKTQILGGYTEENNSKSGLFATELVAGETAILEYYEPSRTLGRSIINISEIAYVYRDYVSKYNQKDFGDGGSCEINVNCPEGAAWQDQKKGVARIMVKEGASYGWCTGSLINNQLQDCTPYFLTADHCGDACTASDLNQWVFYFNYEAPSCSNPATEPVSNTMTGCTLKAKGGTGGSTGSDFFLVLLNGSPTFNPFYNGWDRTNTASTSGVSIHHPAGDIQKISTFTSTLTTSDWNGSGIQSHWQVFWATTVSGLGVTEGGSSGSPIFNSNKLIVGDLTGGGSDCSNQTAPDYYGKIYYSWDMNGTTAATRLKDWLDPNNTGITTLAGSYCGSGTNVVANFIGTPTSIPVGGTVNFTDLSTGSPTGWSWTFTGGTPAVSNAQNPTNIQYNTAGIYTVSLTANNATSSNTATKVNYIYVGTVVSEKMCDTLNNPWMGDMIMYSIHYTSGVYGYISGTNGYSDKAKANFFAPSSPYNKLIGVSFKFGKARWAFQPFKVPVKVWDNTGPGGGPGTVLLTDSIPIQTIYTDVQNHHYTNLIFATPLTISNTFYLGVELPTPVGDTIVLMTNKNGQAMPGTAWEQWRNGTWYPYTDSLSWKYNVTHTIFPILCKQDYGVAENNNSDNILVYPNPTNQQINIDFGAYMYDKINVKVYNLIGDLVKQERFDGVSTNLIKMDLANCLNGIYFLNINIGEKTFIKKISILK
ncbi:MAG: T9SS type A sorting domain-containing protein [Bacteroidota bacterium]